MKLYTYFRSSAAYRVRLALQIKKIDYDSSAIHLLNNGGEQWSPDYLEINPQGVIPTLTDGNQIIQQSLAIIEYLEEMYPTPALLPKHPLDRAYVRSIANVIACDIHPLNNLRVLKYLKHELQVTEEQKNAWYQHWIASGLRAVEALLQQHQKSGAFCFGDTPTLADCCLIPQVYNAQRFACPIDEYKNIQKIVAHCANLPAFHLAAPEQQFDYPAQ